MTGDGTPGGISERLRTRILVDWSASAKMSSAAFEAHCKDLKLSGVVRIEPADSDATEKCCIVFADFESASAARLALDDRPVPGAGPAATKRMRARFNPEAWLEEFESDAKALSKAKARLRVSLENCVEGGAGGSGVKSDLRRAFSKYGAVDSVEYRDRSSSAVVEFRSTPEALAAMHLCRGAPFLKGKLAAQPLEDPAPAAAAAAAAPRRGGEEAPSKKGGEPGAAPHWPRPGDIRRRTVFVGRWGLGVPRSVEEVTESLQASGILKGRVELVVLVRQNYYGFVLLEKEEDARTLIAKGSLRFVREPNKQPMLIGPDLGPGATLLIEKLEAQAKKPLGSPRPRSRSRSRSRGRAASPPKKRARSRSRSRSRSRREGEEKKKKEAEDGRRRRRSASPPRSSGRGDKRRPRRRSRSPAKGPPERPQAGAAPPPAPAALAGVAKRPAAVAAAAAAPAPAPEPPRRAAAPPEPEPSAPPLAPSAPARPLPRPGRRRRRPLSSRRRRPPRSSPAPRDPGAPPLASAAPGSPPRFGDASTAQLFRMCAAEAEMREHAERRAQAAAAEAEALRTKVGDLEREREELMSLVAWQNEELDRFRKAQNEQSEELDRLRKAKNEQSEELDRLRNARAQADAGAVPASKYEAVKKAYFAENAWVRQLEALLQGHSIGLPASSEPRPRGSGGSAPAS
eukprot:tig00020816_g14182.t1